LEAANQALDALSDQIAFWRSERVRPWFEQYATSGGEFAEEHRVAVLEGLKRAEPIYVASEISELLEVAAPSLPLTDWMTSDLLVPEGFALFANPLRLEREGEEVAVGALSWLLIDDPPEVLAISYQRSPGGDLWPITVAYVPFDDPDRHGVPEWELRRLQTLWRLMNQRILVAEKTPTDRAARRRAKWREIRTLIVVTLRRAKRRGDEAVDHGGVDWTHRWLVGGHWRNQWYPSRQRHEPRWIGTYVKGPEGKPFVAKRRAFEFTR
jgi:hypothetical protein